MWGKSFSSVQNYRLAEEGWSNTIKKKNLTNNQKQEKQIKTKKKIIIHKNQGKKDMLKA